MTISAIPSFGARRPALRAIATEQIRFTVASARHAWTLIAVLGLFIVVPVAVSIYRGRLVTFDRDWAAIVVILLAMTIPTTVWPFPKRPTTGGYSHALPVKPSTHALLKASVGWLWLMLLGTVLLVAAFAIGSANTFSWLWVAPLVGGTVLYGVLAAVRSAGPIREGWIGAQFVLFGILILAAQRGAEWISPIVFGRYGVATAGTGQVWSATGAVESSRDLVPVPDFTAWVVASGLWTMAALALLMVAAHWRRDR